MISRPLSPGLTLLMMILMLAGGGAGCARVMPGQLRTSPAQPASLEAVRQEQCTSEHTSCSDFDAIVFVHGIFGGEETFKNHETNFDWPEHLPLRINDRQVDVFRLTYKTALLSWANESNPNFESVAGSVIDALAPLRKREYRSIGFIAHSLGGNIVSTYIHMIKTKLGHPHRSQHAFVITLATPVLGSQIADLGSVLKSSLGMNDELLESLKDGNLYLKMLNEFRNLEGTRERLFTCRPVHLHAAYEKKHLGPLLVVTPGSAAESIASLVNSPVVGFDLDHFSIVKPTGQEHEVYRWVLERIEDEYLRIATWHAPRPFPTLCEDIPFKPEGRIGRAAAGSDGPGMAVMSQASRRSLARRR